MVVKTITIVEEAYNALAREKLPGESFSDTIKRVTKKNNDIGEFFGCISYDDAKSIEKSIKEQRDFDRKRELRGLK